MTITAYGQGAQAVRRSVDTFASIKGDLATLQVKLASGKTAQTYSGLGTAAAKSLDIAGKISTLDGYSANIADGQLRVSLMSAGLSQIKTLSHSLTILPTKLTGNVGQTNVQSSAEDGLKQVIDILNTQVNGRYLFSGRASDTEPVAPYDTILNGDATAGIAGVTQVVAERQAADLGDGKGRLTVAGAPATTTPVAPATATLAEDAANSPFGLKIASAAATGTGATVATVSTSPAATTVTVGAQPAAGDTISVVFDLPDGTQQSVTLKAGTAAAGAASDGSTTYAIGATTDDTAANIAAALGSAVTGLAGTTLASASALKAATDFFADPPQRVAGATPATATALVAGTAADTAIWYKGDTGASPRDTAPVRIGDGQTVGIGAQANEPALRTVLANYAALASGSFPAADATAQSRYAALADRVSTNLTFPNGAQSVTDITTDITGASTSLGSAAKQVKTTRNQLQDTLDGIQNADPTETATKLLAIQTRLEASYQTTSTIGKLSLVNYL